MAKHGKLFGGRVIGAAALAMMFWGLPLVTYSLFAMLNPDNDAAHRFAQMWQNKNQSLLMALTAGLAALFLANDYRQSRRVEWTVRKTIFLGTLMGLVQWIVPLTMESHQEFWVVRTALSSLMLFGFVVLTRLIAQEVNQLESQANGVSSVTSQLHADRS